MAKVTIEIDCDGNSSVMFKCPGCTLHHRLPFRGPGTTWGFNEDVNTPTITPSILSTYPVSQDALKEYVEERGFIRGDNICHSFVTNGKIQFLGDCTHKLKNQTVELPDNY